MARPAAASGPNWTLLSRVAGGVFLIGLTLMIAPMIVCTFADMAGMEVSGVAGDNAQLDAVRSVGGRGGLLHTFGVAAKACAERNSPIGAPVWQHVLTALGLVLTGLFFALGRVSHRRQVKLAAAKQRQARKSLRKERLSRPTGTAGFEAVPRGDTSGPGPAVGASGGHPVTGTFDDPLAVLDAEARASSASASGMTPGGLPFANTSPSSKSPLASSSGMTSGAFGVPSASASSPGPMAAPSAVSGLHDAPPAAANSNVGAEQSAPPSGSGFGSSFPGVSSPGTSFPGVSNPGTSSGDSGSRSAAPGPARSRPSDALPSLDQLTQQSGGWDVDEDGWESFPAEPFVATGNAPTIAPEQAAPTRRAAPPASVSAVAATMPVQPAPSGLLDGIGEDETYPSVDPFASPTGLSIKGARFLGPVTVGRDFSADIDGSGVVANGDEIAIALSVRSSSGQTTPAWGAARTLRSAGRVAPGSDGATLTIAWREIAQAVESVARSEDETAEEVLLSVTGGERTVRVATPIVDRLDIVFRNAAGDPVQPRTVIVEGADGERVRGWIGAEAPGRLVVEGLPAGRCRIHLEDGNPIGHHGGALHRGIYLTTNGVSFDAGSAEQHSLWMLEPKVLYASTFSSGEVGDGSRAAPFTTVGQAIETIRAARAAGDRSFAAAEVRVDPTARLPSNRHGVAASGEWHRWWADGDADPGRPWCEDGTPDALRHAAAPDNAPSFAEELQLTDLTDVRIVNSAYAGLLDRIARSPGFETHLGSELASIPLALVTAPVTGPTTPFRIQIERSARIFIEGVHVLGCDAQSGIAIRDAQCVTLRRCWIDLFRSGTNAATGILAVGRGVQIDTSGGTSSDTSVVLETCDIGWNHAARRAVAVPGAGVAAYDSNLELLHCHVHHNRATAEPADLIVRGESRVKGHDNHRDGNRQA